MLVIEGPEEESSNCKGLEPHVRTRRFMARQRKHDGPHLNDTMEPPARLEPDEASLRAQSHEPLIWDAPLP
jgi:hypothetical protein